MSKTSYPREKINILFLENISETAVQSFQSQGYSGVRRLSGALSEDELIRELKGVQLLGIRSKTRVTRRVLAQCPKLQAIGAFCIGTNQIDVDAANQLGVAVFNAPYSNTRSVAELVIGASIMLIRRIPDKNIAAHSGNWLKDATGSHELRGKKIGLVGYGNIGSQVSILAEAMGMKVHFYDILSKMPLGNAEPCESLAELVGKVDIISLHVPETAQTKNLIDASIQSQFKKGAILINYARGEVVDLEALAENIKTGHLGGAAIDVFPVEPEKNGQHFTSPLQGLPNVLLTPHIGGSTIEAQENIGVDVSNKLFSFLETGNTYGCLSIPAINLPLLEGSHRLLHIHENVPGVLSEVNTALSNAGVNILGQYLSTNQKVGYVVLDVDRSFSKKAMDVLKQVKNTIRTRMLY